MKWTAEVDELNFENLYKQVKSKGAILSSDIEFKFDDETQTGIIIVGAVRTVGKFEIIGTIH